MGGVVPYVWLNRTFPNMSIRVQSSRIGYIPGPASHPGRNRRFSAPTTYNKSSRSPRRRRSIWYFLLLKSIPSCLVKLYLRNWSIHLFMLYEDEYGCSKLPKRSSTLAP